MRNTREKTRFRSWSNTLKAMLSESTHASSLRFCVVLIVITFMLNWTYVCIITCKLVPLPLANLIGLLGVFAMKLGQKHMENHK